MKEDIKGYFSIIRNQFKIGRIIKIQNINQNKIAADLIRNAHSIEKGLCIENPRLGFGHKKQEEIMKQIKKIENSSDRYHREAISMATSVLAQYVEFMKKNNYTDDFIEEIKQFLNDFKVSSTYGGVKKILKKDLNFNEDEIKKFFEARHSIRDFSDEEIDKEKLKKALILAQACPSACNRQAYRVYVLNDNQKKDFSKWLEGIGGFSEKTKSFIIITAKTSSYTKKEINQYIVSASIYAAYLSLTLHLYNFGACIVQRPVVWNKKWEEYRRKFKIPEDEMLICAVAVGNLKKEFLVPYSHRIISDEIIKFM